MARQMKDSGIEWIGEIPAEWAVSRVKYVSDFEPGCNRDGLTDESVITYTPMDCIKNGWFINNTATLGSVSSSLTAYQNGDIVMAKVTPCFENGNIAIMKNLASGYGLGSSELFVFRPVDIDTRYFFYWLRNPMFVQLTCSTMTGTGGLKRVSPYFAKNCYIHQPPLAEQHRIAAFLDRKCAEIDAVIERTKATIEEYKKLKQAVITEAVTKGVRGPRPMKDSGIEWVPELPEEWVVIPSKFLFRNSDVRRQPDDEQLTASQKFGIISQTEYMEREGAKVVLANKGLEDWKHVEPNDFIISLRSFQGGLEMSEVSGCITWHYIVLKPCKAIFSRYFKWLFKSEVYIKALQRTCNFIRDGQDLRYSNFVQVPLYEPSLEEQQEIADYLDAQCAEMDTLIAKKTALLTELETYKKSLIYEYVTGKRECPEAVEQATAAGEYPYFPAAVSTKKLRFAQAMMMAKVLDMHGKGMGRVKLEKMLYTIETSIGFDFDTEYVREAAGPLHESIYKCEGIISRQNHWYQLHQSQYGVSYTPTKDAGKYRAYYDKYFSSYNAEIERIIDIFKPYSTDQAEIVATLFAAWNDAIIDRKSYTDEDIVDDVLNNWHDNKKRFPKDMWLRAMEQMRKNNLIPKGYGKHTVMKAAEM